MKCLECKYYTVASDVCSEGGDTDCPDQDVPCDTGEDKE